MSEASEFDIAVVGGGLHGVSIAAEAASRGLRVVLLQSKDLASGPTGGIRTVLRCGLRKLEQLQIPTVHQNLHEAALLKSKAPHLLRLQKFEVLENAKVRSPQKIQRGLKVYSLLQARQFKKFCLNIPELPKPESFYYHEFQLQNSRLILSLALQANSFGASIRSRHTVLSSERLADSWTLQVENLTEKSKYSLKAKILVNCCGWLASDFLKNILQVPTRCNALASHYTHLIIRKSEALNCGKVLQMDDGKLIYAHKLDNKRFVLGPVFAKDNSEQAKNSALEQAINTWNTLAETKISLADIAHSNWTSRAKPEDPLSNNGGLYRECLLDLDNPGKAAPLLNVFGMCTIRHRILAEQAIEILQTFTSARKNSSLEFQKLPGGDFSEDMDTFLEHYKTLLPSSLHATAERLAFNYGCLSRELLEALVKGTQGCDFGHSLYEVEVRYLVEKEWAKCAEDILWRRTPLGLVFSEEETTSLNTWIKDQFYVS